MGDGDGYLIFVSVVSSSSNFTDVASMLLLWIVSCKFSVSELIHPVAEDAAVVDVDGVALCDDSEENNGADDNPIPLPILSAERGCLLCRFEECGKGSALDGIL
mmetsp:Transcript_33475/g.70380  ORF Transcript_33475/g.70380 Transcript_33475/m.70380 type:complete len:104 (-) Transcript_33475:266-577(-)